MGIIGRARNTLRREGIGGTLRFGVRELGYRAWVTEELIWCHLDLRGDLPRRELQEGLELVRAGEAEIPLALSIGIWSDDVTGRLAKGNDLWLVRGGDQAAFACWIYREQGPTISCPGGWFEVSPGTVFLEGSLTSPDFRGRGIAPGAWVGIATTLQAEGLSSMITRVAPDNPAVRKALMKAGFDEVALMKTTRRGPRLTVRFSDVKSEQGRVLATAFER